MREEVLRKLDFLKIDKNKLNELLEVPKDAEKGDYAIPCFTLAKELKKSPNEIAKDIASKIKPDKNIERVIAAGPYVNFFINKIKLAGELIDRVSKEKDKYGSGNEKKKMMIEFSQPNTHKAFHVGHIRGTSLGESLARISEFSGNKVTRANYSGDTGMHIAKWLWCYKKYHAKEQLKDDESWFASIYADAVRRLEDNEQGQAEVEEINRKLDSRSDKELDEIWKKTRKLSIDSWNKIYHELNTKFDVHFFESEMEKEGKKIAKKLVDKNIAKISDEATIMDLKDHGLSVWVLLRKDGTVLYSAKDLALAEKKFEEFDLDRSIVITDAAQDLHFQQLIKTLHLMKFKFADKYEHVSYGAVRFPWGKMSSRTGDNVLYSDFKKEMVDAASKEIENRYNLDSVEVSNRALAIAIAAIKYTMLKQDSNKNLIFDKKEAMRFEGDTGPYLLYSYARARSILRKANYKKEKKFSINELEDNEKSLISEMASFPEIVQQAYRNLSPNTIANYSYELAKKFNEFYHNVKVMGSPEEQFRLRLVDSFSQTLKNALYLLGINVVEEM